MRVEHDIEKINRENFRSSLEALARPGEPQPILPLFDSGLLAMASVFLYAEVTHYYRGNLEFDMIRALCGSHQTTVDQADYLFLDALSVEHLQLAKSGTAESPELSATIVCGLNDQLRHQASARLTGPGIKDYRDTTLPFDANYAQLLTEKNEQFPFGVDLFFVSPDNMLFGLPRTTKIEVLP
ncbi:MAG: hypothetical protein D6B25_07705 [Desulfobulbaceae bacterium]|nr:MAG: hypothetical protein D6B25_07705 [Desulfobulbaceae bacterium]